ncbi:MAG: peptidase [Planctomycetota bacterium]|nr:MAG: peptidase [Planctomycetota bacterium]
MSIAKIFKSFDNLIKKVPSTLFVPPEKLKGLLSQLPSIKIFKIGNSRDGQPMFGVKCGVGKRKVSLIAGCHADEPVGPMMLIFLCQWLSNHNLSKALLNEWTFIIIPQMNPDGALKNNSWMELPLSFSHYFENAVRELPGDDIEFGFPETASTLVRPENKNASTFLSQFGPFDAHFSLHSLGVGGGVWYLIGDNHGKSSQHLREVLKKETLLMNYDLLNIDRFGEKGFTRLDEGFSTSPTSVKMKEYFLARDDKVMAAKFHWSSMEFIKSLGRDPLMLVSEVPNFISPHLNDLLTKEDFNKKIKFEEARIKAFNNQDKEKAINDFLKEYEVKSMPSVSQMSLQFKMIINSLIWVANK